MKHMDVYIYSRFKYLGLFLCGLIVGGGIVYFYSQAAIPQHLQVVRENSPEYKFINPILFTESGAKSDFHEFDPVIKKITKYINDQTTAKNASTISLYVRELNTSHWTGVNEDFTYAPASMLKVALMIAYIKQAELNPLILDKKLMYRSGEDVLEYYTSPSSLQDGKLYTVRELIQDMIIRSGNDSNLVLLHNIDQNILAKVYTDLHIPLPTKENVDFLSAKSYSVLFRTLYNSTYLSREISEQALNLLSHTTFTQGLVAGVSSTTLVAHKYGERTKEVEGIPTERELHDCGIVYYPQHPYFICVMTRGQEFSKLQTIIKTISEMIFNYYEASPQ